MGWQGAPYKLGCGENRTSYILMYPEVELPWCFSIWGLEGSLPTRNSSWGSMLIGWMVTNCYQVTSILLTWLVVWNMLYFFPYLGNVIIPTDELTFFRGVGIPPTRWNWVCLRTFESATRSQIDTTFQPEDGIRNPCQCAKEEINSLWAAPNHVLGVSILVISNYVWYLHCDPFV